MSGAASVVLDTAVRGELHHAIILHGPVAEALRTLAIRIAKSLTCLNHTTGDACLSCEKIDRRSHPDIHFVEVTGERKMISVDQIRDIVEGASLRPYEGRTKVFIIDPADGLTVGGSNSLLKTLEEPTRDTTFVLLTRSPDLLLPTIRSRSQSIYVGDSARTLGGPHEARRVREVALLDDGDDLARQILDLLHRFAVRGESAALLALATAVTAHEPLKDAFALLGTICCDAAGLPAAESLDPKKLSEISERIPREKLLAAADASLAAIRWMNVNADARLLAEKVVAELVG
ncbi:MAG: DNA polymerase III subunit [Thermoanaerobaculia bacterium]